MVEPMALLENLGDQFRDASKTAGVGVGPGSVVGWGTAFFDFNNDGWLDLFLASTELIWAQDLQRPEGMLFPYPNPLFQNPRRRHLPRRDPHQLAAAAETEHGRRLRRLRPRRPWSTSW